MTDIYSINLTTITGDNFSLESCRNKVILIVNIASKCGFHKQLFDLQELYQKYRDQGFEILAFPCNQFLNQEPNTNDTIQELLSKKYQISFPVFAKTNVYGENINDLYSYLRKQYKKSTILPFIPWNFTKIIIDKTGAVIDRFPPTTKIANVEQAVRQQLLLNKT